MMALTENDIRFGWRRSAPEKLDLHARVWSWQNFLPYIAASVNKQLPLPPEFYLWYDQDKKSACVCAASSKAQAVLNIPQLGPEKYGWWEHYCEACRIDGDPKTSCKQDAGTFLWCGPEVLRKKGPWVPDKGWDISRGLEEYRWGHSVDDVRTAIDQGQPCVFGSPWNAAWVNQLVTIDGKPFIPPRDKWSPNWPGGHAYDILSSFDNIDAFGIANTWNGWPEWVYFHYEDVRWMFEKMGLECAILIDKVYTPPPPPPEEERHKLNTMLHKPDGSQWVALAEFERVR